jgi:PhnB protein
MNITIHLGFPGTCEAAFRFYLHCFGGELATLLPWGDSPISHLVPADWHSKICHATLKLGSATIFGADEPPGSSQVASRFQLLMELDSAEHAAQTFAMLAEGGKITVPLEKTFWAECFGALTDRFGIPWEIQHSA